VSVARPAAEAVIWHDVECGGYRADLPLWEELAAACADPILELGCGAGRVALHLARGGHRVSGLDSDAGLLEALRERAGAEGLEVEAHRGDARDFALRERFALVLAPMQLAQLFDEAGREGMLAGTARHLLPGGRAAFAIAPGPSEPWRAGAGSVPPTPDVRELDGWIYSSLPVGVDAQDGAIAVRRLRQTVSPAGTLEEEEEVVRLFELPPETLEREAEGHGLRPVARHEVGATDEHIGSLVVVMEAGG